MNRKANGTSKPTFAFGYASNFCLGRIGQLTSKGPLLPLRCIAKSKGWMGAAPLLWRYGQKGNRAKGEARGKGAPQKQGRSAKATFAFGSCIAKATGEATVHKGTRATGKCARRLFIKVNKLAVQGGRSFIQ